MNQEERQHEQGPASLSGALGGLSLAAQPSENAPQHASARSPSNVSLQTLRKPPSSPSLHGRSPEASRRVSTARTPSHNPPSPSSRRPSGQFDHSTPTKTIFRRASSMNLSAKSPISSVDSLVIAPAIDPPEVTSASIAKEHFQKELAFHIDSRSYQTETVVIIHDACYGHRFSRPKTSKANLSLIVERPERIQACAVGVAAAYVRLGGRHEGADNAIYPRRAPSSDLPFKIHRSSRMVPLNGPAVTSVHGVKWMQELTAMCNSAADKLASRGKELDRPATPSTLVKPKLHEGDLYLCKESLAAFQGALGGVLDGVDAIFGGRSTSFEMNDTSQRTKRAFVAIRPPGHHCSAGMPSGFCWLNNVHVGIEHAAQTYGLTHAAIIDFDLHHGDGSQAITWERNARIAKLPKNTPQAKKTSIGYFSLHDINSYPCEYGDQEKVQNASLCLENAHNQTIWNVHLQPWKTEADFWDLYETRYSVLLEKMRVYLKNQTERIRASSPSTPPIAAIFISAGFDASEWEGEGMQRHKVNVPTDFYARFTQDIIRLATEDGNGVDGRVISVLEGGYSDRALTSGVFSHLSGLAGIRQKAQPILLGSITNTVAVSEVNDSCYNVDWWNSSMLGQLEALRNPIASLPVKKTRPSELSTYATLTQSFTAKIVDPAKMYRSVSGSTFDYETSRPLTPPPPEVDWATAAFELSKLLIASDRQINSYRHEELSESRAKSRHSAIGLPTELPVNEKRELRGRKAKLPLNSESGPTNGMDLPIRNASSSSRRQTISELPSAAERTDSSDLTRPSTSDSKATSDHPKTVKPQSTRRASSTRADLMLKTSPSKAPPVPKVPSKFAGRPNLEKTTSTTSTNGTIVQGDVDSLTTAVKKITLKMSSKESSPTLSDPPIKAARKPAVPRLSGPKGAPLKPPVPRASKAKPLPTLSSNVIKKEPPSSPKPAHAVPVQPSDISVVPPPPVNMGTFSSIADVETTSETSSSPIITPPKAATQSPTKGFIPYDPSSHYVYNEGTVKAEKPESLTWLPPNTSTPTQSPMKRGKEHMPVFTSSGMIPFARDGRPDANTVERQKNEDDSNSTGAGKNVWDVPPTPQI